MSIISTFLMNILRTAEKAPNLASILNISAFNFSNTCGALIGGLMIATSLGL
ncbi:hypothetical protein LJK88_26295 [Paenibacillus sp. P26]|nr:hypothetical protein LJK88_26295 [Paenibacillus sp. P26]UUZ97887.1 hypothetical protein LJK87_11675 [Paenibacillus sp. P25]